MKLFKKKTEIEKLKATNSTITKLDKSQLEAVIGGVDTIDSTTLTTSTSYVEGNPIGGIVVKGGRNPGSL